MPLPVDNSYIQVPGLVHVLFAMPSSYTTLFKLGESENGIQVRKNPMMGRVSGDRYGGNEGAPIEMQFLGLTAEFELALSRWDPVQLTKLETFGGLLTTAGTVPLQSIGALLLRDRGIRVLLYCTRDPSQSINFPCCTWDKPQTVGKATKYSVAGLGVTAHRAPEGYAAVSA
jgi:hypothetical protein